MSSAHTTFPVKDLEALTCCGSHSHHLGFSLHKDWSFLGAAGHTEALTLKQSDDPNQSCGSLYYNPLQSIQIIEGLKGACLLPGYHF